MNSIKNENQNCIERTYSNWTCAPIINIDYNNNDSQLNNPKENLPSLEEIQKSKITPGEEEFVDSKNLLQNKNPEIYIANKSLNDNIFINNQQDYPCFEEVYNSSTPQGNENNNKQNDINKEFLFDLIKGLKNNDKSIENKILGDINDIKNIIKILQNDKNYNISLVTDDKKILLYGIFNKLQEKIMENILDRKYNKESQFKLFINDISLIISQSKLIMDKFNMEKELQNNLEIPNIKDIIEIDEKNYNNLYTSYKIKDRYCKINNEFIYSNKLCNHHLGTLVDMLTDIKQTICNINKYIIESNKSNNYFNIVLEDILTINNLIKALRNENKNNQYLPTAIKKVSNQGELTTPNESNNLNKKKDNNIIYEEKKIYLDNIPKRNNINEQEINEQDLDNDIYLLNKWNNINKFFMFGPLYKKEEQYLLSIFLNKLQLLVFDNIIRNPNVLHMIQNIIINLWNIFNKSYGILNIKNQINDKNNIKINPHKIILKNLEEGQDIDIIFDIFQNITMHIYNKEQKRKNNIQKIYSLINGNLLNIKELKILINEQQDPSICFWNWENKKTIDSILRKLKSPLYDSLNHILNNHKIKKEQDIKEILKIVKQLSLWDESYNSFTNEITERLNKLLILIHGKGIITKNDLININILFHKFIAKYNDIFNDSFVIYLKSYKKEFKSIHNFSSRYIEVYNLIEGSNLSKAKIEINNIFEQILNAFINHEDNNFIDSDNKNSLKIPIKYELDETYIKLKNILMGITNQLYEFLNNDNIPKEKKEFKYVNKDFFNKVFKESVYITNYEDKIEFKSIILDLCSKCLKEIEDLNCFLNNVNDIIVKINEIKNIFDEVLNFVINSSIFDKIVDIKEIDCLKEHLIKMINNIDYYSKKPKSLFNIINKLETIILNIRNITQNFSKSFTI